MPLTEIANWIESGAGRLLDAWVVAVRSDATISSDEDLTEGGLVDHVPQLIEEVCAVLRSGGRPTVENTQEARVHAYTRFRQGYRARDLVRETSLLRTILSDHVAAALLRATNGHADPLPHLEAIRTINLYMDEELRYAVSIYTEAADGRQ